MPCRQIGFALYFCEGASLPHFATRLPHVIVPLPKNVAPGLLQLSPRLPMDPPGFLARLPDFTIAARERQDEPKGD